MMTPEKQRIAIAEACGWKWEARIKGSIKVWNKPPLMVFYDSELPNYLTDLNAMHEAEKVLTEKGVNTWWTYVDFINRHNLTPFGQSTAVHATAARRAEAFLRTIGKWEGE
jgi:hypothetical protein